MRTWHQEEIRRWKKFVKSFGNASIQVRVAFAEDDPHWSSERVHLRYHLRAIPHGEWQILIQAKESGLCTRRGSKLLIEQGHELISDCCLSHESADLPPIHLTEEKIVKCLRDDARNVSHRRGRKEPDGFRCS